MKDSRLHDSATLQPQYIGIQLAISAIEGFEKWTLDVIQAYLQSKQPLDRVLFTTKQAPELDIHPENA